APTRARGSSRSRGPRAACRRDARSPRSSSPVVPTARSRRSSPARRSPGRRSGNAYADAVLARAPASSANLGPGFDAVALALSLYVEVEVTDAPSLRVTLDGEGASLPADASNLAVAAA